MQSENRLIRLPPECLGPASDRQRANEPTAAYEETRDLSLRLLGDAYNEVEMTILERLPGLAFCIRRVNSELVFQDFEGDWGYLTSGFDTSAEGVEAIRTQISHKILGKDAPTGIPSAEEKNLEPLGGSFHRRKQTTC